MINKSYLKPVMKVLYKPKAKPFHQKFKKNLIKYNVITIIQCKHIYVVVVIIIIIMIIIKKKKPSQDVTVNNDLEARHVYLNCLVLSFKANCIL